MKRYWVILFVSILLFVGALAPVSAQPVTSFDTPVIDTYQLSCGGGSVEGSSTAQYVAILVDYRLAKALPNDLTNSHPIRMPVKHTELIRTNAKVLNGYIYFGDLVVVPVVDGHFSGGVFIPEAPEGTPVLIQVFPVLSVETPYAIGGSWTHVEPCKPYIGPYPEADYVQRTIICATPIYDSPAGGVVPGTAITIGQTFFVDPNAVTAADSTSWNQIFVGGWANGYIRSECVQ